MRGLTPTEEQILRNCLRDSNQVDSPELEADLNRLTERGLMHTFSTEKEIHWQITPLGKFLLTLMEEVRKWASL